MSLIRSFTDLEQKTKLISAMNDIVEINCNSLAFCTDFKNFHIFGGSHHLYNMDVITRFLHLVRKEMSVSFHQNTHQTQYTKI